MELAYASLYQLCAPLLDRLEGLPGPHRQALGYVFGLTLGTAQAPHINGAVVPTDGGQSQAY